MVTRDCFYDLLKMVWLSGNLIDSIPEYSIFSKGSKFIQKQIITTAKILYIKTTAESLT